MEKSAMKKRDNTSDLGSTIRRLMRSGKMKHKYYQSLIHHFFFIYFGYYYEDIKDIQLYEQKLVLRVESAALRNELQLSKQLLQKRLNEVLQEEYLKEIDIRWWISTMTITIESKIKTKQYMI